MKIIFREMVPEAIICTLVTNGETADKEDKFLRILILAEDLELCCPLW